MPKFSTTIQKELFSLFSLVWIVCLAFLYYAIATLSLNLRLLVGQVENHVSFSSLLSLISSLLFGAWTGLSHGDFFLLILNSILVGTNVYLAGKTLYIIEHRGKVRVSIGGATIISLITTGCASCGLSLLSILGLSASLSFLPFHGMELHLFSIFLLLFSSLYMLRQLHNAKYCKIKK